MMMMMDDDDEVVGNADHVTLGLGLG